MGDLLQFPRGHQPDNHPTDGTAVRAVAERIDTTDVDPQPTGTEPEPERAAGAELEVRPDTLPVRRERGPLVPAELREKARDVGQSAARSARRHAIIVAKGIESARQQRKAEKTQADLKAARSAAAAAGDYATVKEISARMSADRLSAIETAKARLDLCWEMVKKAAVAICVITGIALVVGLINGFGGWLGQWNALDVLWLFGMVITGLFRAVQWSVLNWATLGPAAMLTVTAVWLSRRWRDGRRLGEQVLPANLRRGAHASEVPFDENALVAALANIGVPALSAAAKEGWPNRDSDNAWVQFPHKDGNGMGASLRLPMNAPVEKVQKAKVSLAHNLGCLPAELWLSKNDDDPQVLDLFRLDRGELRKPAPEYPLLHGGEADYFKGFPVGISPRGTEITGHTFERNWVASGIMGSGKSTLVIDLLAGAALDPLVDIDVFVFAENADYDPLRPVLNRFVMGDTEENVEACQDHIADLHADLTNRGKLLQKHGVRKVNREVAAKEPGLRPRIVVIDECQSYFRQDKPEDRRAVVNQMVRFFSAARKYGITCVFITPVPSDQSLPRDLVAVTSNLACFAIGDKTRNNVVLGDKAHENGISALGLKPANPETGELNDVGTAITRGFTTEDGTPLRTYYLDNQALKTVVDRALEIRGGRVERDEPEDKPDLLADVLEVMGTAEESRGAEVASALGARWARYRGWKRADLVEALADRGVIVPSTGNTWPVKRDRVVTAQSAVHDDEPNED
ncbi:ATP-binding protein [Saccharopolyspora hirsuta]|uniref:ATP-binding protein n=1 Tax=Saccharopolyspora hirsuta TaxID=1837 RepID=A0A5M7BN03_SACHI|nr:zonular occludens toxin domain-containing protein [Saccharopolyspora hirsuta]KAA5829557.1 ATP-binding protein [Saccharopolyspora hirsuta]